MQHRLTGSTYSAPTQIDSVSCIALVFTSLLLRILIAMPYSERLLTGGFGCMCGIRMLMRIGNFWCGPHPLPISSAPAGHPTTFPSDQEILFKIWKCANFLFYKLARSYCNKKIINFNPLALYKFWNGHDTQGWNHWIYKKNLKYVHSLKSILFSPIYEFSFSLTIFCFLI